MPPKTPSVYSSSICFVTSGCRRSWLSTFTPSIHPSSSRFNSLKVWWVSDCMDSWLIFLCQSSKQRSLFLPWNPAIEILAKRNYLYHWAHSWSNRRQIINYGWNFTAMLRQYSNFIISFLFSPASIHTHMVLKYFFNHVYVRI